MAHLILFTDANFQGEHKHVFDRVDALSLVGTDANGQPVCLADCDFPAEVSSIVIFSGNWQFSASEDQAGPFDAILGPGLYPFVRSVKLPNDAIRSLMPVADAPTMTGDPLGGEAILFENADFRGAHQHVFRAEGDLGKFDFARKTSAIVVKSGNWSFYSDTQFDGSYPQQPVFGPGIYRWVEDVGIANDTVSSLQPSSAPATVGNSVDDEVILFQYGGLYGPHRHVFAPEANLNADDDDFFNDNVGSLAVLAGIWSFYADAHFDGNYGIPAAPGLYPALAALDVAVDDMSSLRPVIGSTVTPGDPILGHVILFKDAGFHGPHKHVFNQERNLNAAGDDGFNDSVSSLAILLGNWQFFRNAGFDDDYPTILGPGLYPWVEDAKLRNDDLSSLRIVQAPPTMNGDPVTAHVLLFEHASFHGAHKHVFVPEPNLDADGDAAFDDLTSSLAVLQGRWATYADANFERQYRDLSGLPVIVGPSPGANGDASVPASYKSVTAVQIGNDDLTSLQPVDQAVTAAGDAILGQVILFKDAHFRGDHKHVFNVETSLGADDDDGFDDATSSIAVLQGNWFTYRDPQLQRAYDVVLGEGLFASVQAVGIADNDLSSLSLAGDRRLFVGTATIKIKSGQVPDPVVVQVAMTFVVDQASGLFRVENGFGPLGVLSLATITYDSADDGAVTPDGQISIPNFKVTGSSGILSEDVSFLLSTGSASNASYSETGTPVSMPALVEGSVLLVAVGTLGGDDFSIELAGELSAAS